MIRDFSSDNYEEQLEHALASILLNGSDTLKLMLKFFSLLDAPKIESAQLQPSYSMGNRKIHIIKTSQELEDAMKNHIIAEAKLTGTFTP